MRNNVSISRKCYEAIKELPHVVQGEVMDAVFRYVFYEEQLPLEGITRSAFLLIKPMVEPKEQKISSTTPIAARKKSFADELKPYLPTYGKDLLNDFYKYWAEPNQSNTKFRKEMEKTWDTERRLETWSKRDKSFSKPLGTGKKMDISDNTYKSTSF